MLALYAGEEFNSFIEKQNSKLDDLSPERAIELMISFYNEFRADDCSINENGDMLLFQWGVYNWGQGENFEYNITRQLIFPEEFEEDSDNFEEEFGDDEEEWEQDSIWQLSLTLKFSPDETMRAMESGHKWCSSPKEIDEFKEFIKNNLATKVVSGTLPTTVELFYEPV